MYRDKVDQLIRLNQPRLHEYKNIEVWTRSINVSFDFSIILQMKKKKKKRSRDLSVSEGFLFD